MSDVKSTVVGKDGVFELNPFLLHVFDGKGSGSLQADFTKAAPLYHVTFALSQFQLEKLTKTMSSDMGIEGRMDFTAKLSMQGKTTHQVKENVAGQITLRGKNLIIKGSDLDLEFSRFESSQNYSLVDAGAVFFAGPFAVFATKGLNVANVFRGSGGSSQIHRLVSDWQVEHGIAKARDVAMATNENRVALRGEVNLVTEHFNEMTVALIDDQGCAKVRQKIHGSFQEPEVEAPNIFKSLSGPMVNLFKKGMDLMSIGDCEVFYAGSVAPPK
jgi:AsmA protein